LNLTFTFAPRLDESAHDSQYRVPKKFLLQISFLEKFIYTSPCFNSPSATLRLVVLVILRRKSMSQSFLAKARQHLAVGTSLFALLVNLGAPVASAAQEPAKKPTTTTPIKHVIVII